MSRDVVVNALAALVLAGFAKPAAAHHPPQFERCQLVTIGGQVERVDWRNPHVKVTVTAYDGTRYEFIWLSPHRLGLGGIEKETLQIGDRVVAMGTMQRDDTPVTMLLSDVRRPADGWQWSQLPQGC
jgi:hypothetical protein